MPPSRTPLIFPELPRELPVVRRGGRAVRCRGSARSRPRGFPLRATDLGRRVSTPIATKSHARLAGGDDHCRRPRYHPPATAGMRRGIAPPTRYLSPRLLPLSVPLPMPSMRDAHSHKRARVKALLRANAVFSCTHIRRSLCVVVFLRACCVTNVYAIRLHRLERTSLQLAAPLLPIE